MEDNSVSEVMVNGPNAIYVQRYGKIELTDIKFDTNQHLAHTIQKLLVASGTSRRVNKASPYVDFSITDSFERQRYPAALLAYWAGHNDSKILQCH